MGYTLVMLGLILIGLSTVIVMINRRAVVIMVVRMRGGVMIKISGRRHRVDRKAMISIDFVRVRLHGSGRAGPHERGSQKDRNELTREGHLALD